MIKLMMGAVLALSAASAFSGNMYIYKSSTGKVLLTNVSNPRDSFDKFTEKVKVTYYKGDEATNSNISYGTSNSSTTTNYKRVEDVSQAIDRLSAQAKEMKTKSSSSASTAFAVPNGYRLPTETDNFGDWKTFNAPNHVKADFNGDGIEDEAYLLPKKGSKLGYGVFVSLNKSKTAVQRGHNFQMFKLTDSNDMSPQSFSIDLAEPSDEIWKSACGKGYWKCEAGEPSAFKINLPSIMFCYIESACTMYMWDSQKLTFKEITFSD